ncbi:hypothetical protein BV898_05757 [Hypsibius exemplaris]|uniref:UMA domain-containing protein n=1 Tax=Hypsibius exemplaris TaxID=2072580 RepID=A0A1W0WYC2_HYPEX|nr:hypothetical protein BV898_05757 [Hypsibius exemplaris]
MGMRFDNFTTMGTRGGSGNQGATLHSFLEGIQIRLTDKYKPQRRVILPPDCTNRLQEDIEAILDLDYDFKLEQQVLAVYAQQTATASVEDSDDRSSSSWPPAAVDGLTPVVPAVSQTSSTTAVESVSTVTKPKGPPPRPPPPVKDAAAGVSINPFLASVSYRPMEPQKAQLPGASAEAAPSNAHTFRVEDFEPNSANPFDHLELKSLNDMEQLQQVLARDKETSKPPP